MYSARPLARRTCLSLAIAVAPHFAVPVAAQITAAEAVAAIYPGAVARAEQVLLTPSQRKQALEQSDADIPTAVVTRFVATRDGVVVGRAYVDAHTVRTATETLLIALGRDGAVLRVDLLGSLEPADYQPSGAWLAQYRDRILSDDLALNRAIRPLAGATVTARAANDAVRRTLAIDALLPHGDAR
jgi:hypothetical protein